MIKPDITLTWNDHLKNGLVWRVNLELAMEDVGDSTFYSVDVYVVAPNQSLAQYIATTIYPEFECLSVDDEPMTPQTYSRICKK